MSKTNLSSLKQSTSLQYDLSTSIGYQYGAIPPPIGGEPTLATALDPLQFSAPQMSPAARHHMSYILGCVMYRSGDFWGARRAFVMAHQAVETLRGRIEQEYIKRQLAAQSIFLYRRLVHCCVMLDPDHHEAFKYAVSGKGRVFIDRLASRGFDFYGFRKKHQQFNEDFDVYLQFFNEIDQRRTRLATQKLKYHIKNRLHNEIDAIIQKQVAYWEKLAQKYPALTATQAAPTLTAAQALKLADDLNATLVEFVEHEGGWSAFVVRPEAVLHVPLPLLDDKLLSETLKWINLVEREAQKRTPYLKKESSLKEAREILSQLYQAVIAPLRQSLPENRRLILAPFGDLHLLPLHAAFNEESEKYLDQEYVISFTPSLSALHVALTQVRLDRESAQKPISCSEQPRAHSPPPLLNVAYPGQRGYPNYLLEAVRIAKKIALFFENVTQLYDDKATLEAIIRLAPNHEMINLFAHNQFNPDQPEHSGLMLCGGLLTVQRIITQLNLQQTQLVTLVGCGTGQAQINQGEELVGLIQALMIAKAKAVVAGLWKINMTPTLTLFEHFYDKIYAGQSPAEALRQATLHVRYQEKWKHPYYWAAFQASGLAYELDM